MRDTSEQPSENSRGIDALCGKATIRSRSLKMSLSPSTPSPRFPEANARINYEPCSNSRTEERRAAGANGVAEGGGHPYYGRSWETPRFLCPYVSLSLSFRSLSSTSPLFYFCFEALFNFCREIFPSRNDYCSLEIAERWRRKTGFGCGLSCLRTMCRDATHQTRNCARKCSEKSYLRHRIMIDVFPEAWIIHLHLCADEKTKNGELWTKTCEFGELRNVSYTWAIIADIRRTVTVNC